MKYLPIQHYREIRWVTEFWLIVMAIGGLIISHLQTDASGCAIVFGVTSFGLLLVARSFVGGNDGSLARRMFSVTVGSLLTIGTAICYYDPVVVLGSMTIMVIAAVLAAMIYIPAECLRQRRWARASANARH